MLDSLVARRTSASALVVLGAALAAAPAAAQTPGPTGHLTFSGVADAYDVGSRGVRLTFAPFFSGATGNTDAFASFNATRTRGTLRAFLVGSGTQPMRSFLKIGGYTFHLKQLPASGYGQDKCKVDAEVGQQCTPLQTPRIDEAAPSDTLESPFALENVASGFADPNYPITSRASFSLVGTVVAPGGARGLFTGTIATEFEGVSYQDALTGLEFVSGLGGELPVAYRAEFDVQPGFGITATPEPATVATLGAGLLGLLGVARARRRRAA